MIATYSSCRKIHSEKLTNDMAMVHLEGMCFGSHHFFRVPVCQGPIATAVPFPPAQVGRVLPPCALWMKWTSLICIFLQFTLHFVFKWHQHVSVRTVSLGNEWSLTWHNTWTFWILNNHHPSPRPLLHLLMVVQLPIPCFRFRAGCEHIYIILCHLCHAISCCDN